jgi:acyl-CoA thioesterase I
MKSLDVSGLVTRRLTLYGIKGGAINLIARHIRVWLVLTAVILCPVAIASGASADQIKLLAFGDSLTAGYGLPKAEGFTEQLQSVLRAEGQDVVVINAGVSGDTSSGGRSRLDWALADTPDAVLLELGANDGLRGIDPSVTRENLDAILDRLSDLGIPVLFTGMHAPPNLGAEYGAEYSAVFADLSIKHDVVFYPFFLEGVAGKASLNQIDGIHPNPDGVAVLVTHILPSVHELLARIGR